jgi:hypothetical protein
MTYIYPQPRPVTGTIYTPSILSLVKLNTLGGLPM